MRQILLWPHPALSTRCTPAQHGPILDRLIENLVETAEATPNCVGLAAPQIGSTQRVCVIRRPAEEPLVLINPEGVSLERWEVGPEQCLSLPGVTHNVSRPTFIVLATQYVAGGKLSTTTITISNPWMARVVAHEIDHLEGKTILDYMSRQTRKLAMRNLEAGKARAKHPPLLKSPASQFLE